MSGLPGISWRPVDTSTNTFTQISALTVGKILTSLIGLSTAVYSRNTTNQMHPKLTSAQSKAAPYVAGGLSNY